MFASLFITMAAWTSLVAEARYLEPKLRPFIPIKMTPDKWIVLVIALAVIGYAHGCTTILMPAHLYFMWLALLRGSVLVAALLIGGRIENLVSRARRLMGMSEMPRKEAVSLVLKVFGVIVILSTILMSPLGLPLLGRYVDFTRASHLRGRFATMGVGDITLFPEIDPAELRVTTSGIARSIAEMKKTSAASWVTSVHLGFYGGKLCWIATVSEPPMFGSLLVGASNRIREIIVVPVTDATGEEAEVIPFEAEYAEGLWFDKEMRVYAQDRFPLRSFSRAYLTWSPDLDKLVYITTSYYEEPFGPLRDPRVHVWDPQTGALLAEYRPSEAPDWIVQRWDEEWLERMGDAFGDFRWTADNELNFWNGIPYYSDRSADPAEPAGLRYQMWDNELVGVYLFHNKRNPSLLEFVIIAKKDGVYLYSLDHLALISPSEAKSVAKAGLPALPGGEYTTPLALLYRIGNELYYHIPIFIWQEDRYIPAYFALVRATDRRCIRTSCAEHGGMREAVLAAYSQVKRGIVRYIQVNGTIVGKYEYVEGGNTRIWIDIDLGNGTVVSVLAKVELLDPEDVYLLLSKGIGDWISVLVDEEMVIVDVLG